MSHYVFTTTAKVTKAAAKRINRAIKSLDESASFVGPLKIAGNQTTGWIERPNDGTNDYPERRKMNQVLADIAKVELDIQ